jgi:hypothetical protein
MKVFDIVESKKENHIFMRFGLKKPVAAVAGEDARSYIVGYAGFANTPADLRHGEAQWKFYNLDKKEDFVKAVKKIMTDDTFTKASGITFYVDVKSLLKKYPGYGEFIAMIERTGGEKFSVEYKPDSDREKPEKGAGKKRTVGQWADPDAKVEPAEKQTTRYFSVTSPRLMSQLRRNDRIMQYYRPNRNAFVMGPKEFDAFVKAFGRDDIKIVDRFKEEVEVNEALPLIPLVIAGARLAGPSLARQGARILSGAGRGAAATPGAVAQVGRGVGAAGTGVGIGAAGLAVNDIVQMAKQGIESLGPVIESVLGNEALKKIVSFSSQYGLPILAAIAILYGGKKVIDFLRKKGESIEETATAGGTSAGGIAGFAVGIGSPDPKKKKKSKLIRR